MTDIESDITGAEQRVWLAVLGKHPGWNDHLDDIGLDTERLVAVKRHLYVEGIGGLINAGSWEALEESIHDDGFAHTFFWRQPDGMVIGRMWSSSDGKGRRKYPMIACAMCRSLPFSFVAGPLLDRLRRLESVCQGVDSAAEVIAATDATRRELADLASHVPVLTGTDFEGPGSAATLIESGVLGEEGVGLKRVLYQIDREMGAYIRPESGATASRSRSVEIRGQHIRVPSPVGEAVRGNEQSCMGLWCRLMLSKIDPLVPMFFVTKDGRPWVDIVVGELGPTPLACLQTNTEGLPYGSDIPFTIDDETEALLDATIQRSRAGEVAEKDPCFVDAPQDRLAPFLRPRRAERSSTEPGKGKTYLIIAAVITVLVLVIIGVSVFGGGGEDTKSDSAQGGPEKAQPESEQRQASVPEPDAPVAADAGTVGDRAERLGAFNAWCDGYRDWYAPFIAASEGVGYEGDPGFAQSLGAAIDRAEAAGDAIDPLQMTPGRFRSLESLRATPPEEIYEPGFGETIDTGARLIASVRGVLAASEWPARARLNALVERASRHGASVPDDIRALLASLAGNEGAEAAEAAHRLSGLSRGLTKTAGSLEVLDQARNAAASIEAELVGPAFQSLDPFHSVAQDSPGAWIAGVGARCDTLTTLGTGLVEASSSLLPRVDRGLLAGRMESVPLPETSEHAEAYLSAWLEAINDPSLYMLDPETDPRRGLPPDGAIASLRESLEVLSTEKANTETRELDGILGVVEQTVGPLRALSWNEATKNRVEGEASEVLRLVADLGDRIDAERRTRALQTETYIAELRATGSVTATGSVALDEAWTAWRDRTLAGFDDSSTVVTLSRAVDQARGGLASLEQAMPRVVIVPGVFGTSGEAIGKAAEDYRERAIAEAAEAAAEGSVGRDAIGAYTEWARGLEASATALTKLRGAMSSWSLPGDVVGGESVASIVGSWSSSWAASSVDFEADEPALTDYIRAVRIESVDTAMALIEDKGAPPAAIHVAWLALDRIDPAWGSSRGQAQIDADAVTRLRGSMDMLPDDAASGIAARISDVARTRWLRAADASSAGDFKALAGFASRIGLDTDALPWAARLNLFVAELRVAVGAGDAFDREALLVRVRALRTDAVAPADTWLDAFEGELASREGREIDYRVIGPARAGWGVEHYHSGRLLVYTWPGSETNRRLYFRLVESPEAGVFYLSDTESPLWLLTEFALGGEHAQGVLATLPPDWDPLPDTRLGPRVWAWSRRGSTRELRRSATWVPKSAAGDRPVYADSVRELVKNPSDESPIQRVSPIAAASLAAAAGCRLPTEAEWRAAHASIGSPAPSDSFNLRDSTFESQRAHTSALGTGISVTWPDQQSFCDGMTGIAVGRDAVSHAWKDNLLWFSEVGTDKDGPFHDLIGNVAEFVLDSPSRPLQLTDRAGSVADHVRALSTHSELAGVGIIGGSALSAPGVPIDTASHPSGLDQVHGYTDVGFRLAFSPGVEAPLVVVIGEALNTAPYLRIGE